MNLLTDPKDAAASSIHSLASSLTLSRICFVVLHLPKRADIVEGCFETNYSSGWKPSSMVETSGGRVTAGGLSARMVEPSLPLSPSCLLPLPFGYCCLCFREGRLSSSDEELVVEGEGDGASQQNSNGKREKQRESGQEKAEDKKSGFGKDL
ncbi:unnamed protein product [Victoria cruziana]